MNAQVSSEKSFTRRNGQKGSKKFIIEPKLVISNWLILKGWVFSSWMRTWVQKPLGLHALQILGDLEHILINQLVWANPWLCD